MMENTVLILILITIGLGVHTTKGIYLVAGYHVDLLTKFYLSWDGDSTLDPGTYYSDVTITYQIQ
jgi:hypothetical protein